MIRLQNIKKRLIIFECAPETLHYQKSATLFSRVVLTWFHSKGPKIKWRTEISITIHDFSFQMLWHQDLTDIEKR